MYCETLKRLRKVIQNKRRGLLTFSIVILHDNARAHGAACTPTLLEHLNWELFDSPPYSLDLAPKDFSPFIYLKDWMRS
ncbi:hypothetical protein B7P43_G02895 [Cryptotermes secundus]|uniref:Tc1-like transposase DDE domain-containing protein n=1 Tax=Cryptotermes secundus TaxID=105785 RepID=A0A2J7QG09_9NEOP|nr:hypothetical protein B7P43_G02895 [Cryptotermes secundus]